jgi:photosystem II stability/assembly factor-like uncharacterized protein
MTGHRFSGWSVLVWIVLAVCASAPALAARWEPLPLWGGNVLVAAAQGDSSVVYAASPTAGLYQSVDSGRTWQFVGHGPGRLRLHPLGVDPHDPRRLYALGDASNSWGFFRSQDGGKHWQRIDAGLPEFVLVPAVEFDPATPGRIYAGTSWGLYRSNDWGTTWAYIALEEGVVEVALAPGDPQLVLAGTRSEEGQEATQRSSDGGETFVKVFDEAMGHIAFDPSHPGRVYGLSLAMAVYRSDDLGATWTALPLRGAFQGLAVTRGGTLLVSSFDRGVARSADGGFTWDSVPGTEEARPHDVIWSFAVLGDSVLAGGFRGVWRSLTDGLGWRASNTGIRGQWIFALEAAADAGSTLWASAVGGVFLSRDQGASFSRLAGLGPTGYLDRLAIHPRRPQVIYGFGCCTADLRGYGLLKSEDGGRSWHHLPYTVAGGEPEPPVLEVDPVNPDIVYAGGLVEPHTASCAAARSTDGGTTWSCMSPLASADFTGLAFDPQDSRILYGLFNGRIYRSANRGQTWERIAARARSIDHLTVDPFKRDRLFALPKPGSGVLRSEDGGRTWALVKAGLPAANTIMHDLLADPSRPGRLWAAVEVFQTGAVLKSTGRVYRSDDAGRHWTSVSEGLEPGAVVLHLAADPRAAGVIYAGTAGRGLYRLNE